MMKCFCRAKLRFSEKEQVGTMHHSCARRLRAIAEGRMSPRVMNRSEKKYFEEIDREAVIARAGDRLQKEQVLARRRRQRIHANRVRNALLRSAYAAAA